MCQSAMECDELEEMCLPHPDQGFGSLRFIRKDAAFSTVDAKVTERDSDQEFLQIISIQDWDGFWRVKNIDTLRQILSEKDLKSLIETEYGSVNDVTVTLYVLKTLITRFKSIESSWKMLFKKSLAAISKATREYDGYVAWLSKQVI